MKSLQLTRGLLALFVVLAMSVPASAAFTLYDKDEATFSVDGFFNTFYVHSSSDNEISGVDRDQSRVKMGFLPNYIGFNFSKQIGNLKLGGRSSFWVSINDSDDNYTGGGARVTDTAIDVRQFYGTVDADWGQVLIGKDFGLFCRTNIFSDEILTGYGNVSDTLGLIDGGGVSFGNIGSGYIYPTPTSQITYRSPEMSGFKLAVGLLDPSRTSTGGGGEEKMPRIEGELTYRQNFDPVSVIAWVGGTYQSSENGADGDVDSQGVSYGLNVKFASFSLTGSGYTGSGIGFLAGPGGDTALGIAITENGDEVDSSGYLVQGSYTFEKLRFVASYGYSKMEYATEWEDETVTGAVFYSINDYFKLVAEYNVNTFTIGSDDETTNTIALGGVINF